MNLTGGQYKGLKIEVPQNVKPTLSKVRESVFNILFQYDLGSMRFLDLFAGSGIMGLEAISRGYQVKEVELNSKNANIVKNNYKKIKLNCDITIANALKYNDGKYDVIYLDPPWDMDYKPILNHCYELLDEDGLIVVEYDKNQNIDLNEINHELGNIYTIIKDKKYGRCLISILIKNKEL